MTFKPMMTLAFTFDHRVLDGATADAFCVAVEESAGKLVLSHVSRPKKPTGKPRRLFLCMLVSSQ
ncbi:MAG: 2-oxo acid dehydrogenase subunit E2 [Caldilineaceae bacterium]